MPDTRQISPTRLAPFTESSEPIIFGAPDLREEEIDEVVDTLRSGWIGTGPKTKRFEEEFSSYLGVRHAVATNSGTAALHLALSALGIGPGDEVITTPLTFVATANVIEHCGARPVFADVSLVDGNIDPNRIDEKVTPRTKAIMPVHYSGSLASVGRICERHPKIPVVVDAAHAVEARYPDGSGSAGQGATCTAYSFYVTKNLMTGEGGMLVTDDEELARDARIRSLHGLDNDAWKRYSSGGYGEYELRYPGFKYNMTDLQASLGIHQLKRLEKALERRCEIWERYNDAFKLLLGVKIPPVAGSPDKYGRHARHLYALWLDWASLGLSRREFVVSMRDWGIGTGWHFKAVHQHAFYREKYGYESGSFPHAEWIAERTVSIPLSSKLTDAQVDRIIETVLTLLAQAADRNDRRRRLDR